MYSSTVASPSWAKAAEASRTPANRSSSRGSFLLVNKISSGQEEYTYRVASGASVLPPIQAIVTADHIITSARERSVCRRHFPLSIAILPSGGEPCGADPGPREGPKIRSPSTLPAAGPVLASLQ